MLARDLWESVGGTPAATCLGYMAIVFEQRYAQQSVDPMRLTEMFEHPQAFHDLVTASGQPRAQQAVVPTAEKRLPEHLHALLHLAAAFDQRCTRGSSAPIQATQLLGYLHKCHQSLPSPPQVLVDEKGCGFEMQNAGCADL